MLKPETMRKVSVIAHKRRLPYLIGRLGEMGVVEIIKHEHKFLKKTDKQLRENLTKIINDLRDKIKTRFAQLVERLGEKGTFQINKLEPIFFKEITKELEEKINKTTRDLQEKIRKLLEESTGIEADSNAEKLTIEGSDLEDILNQITPDIEKIFTDWTELQKTVNTLSLKIENMKNIQKSWGELLKITQIDFVSLKKYRKFIIKIGYTNWKNIDLFQKSLENIPHLFYDKKIDDELALFVIASLQKHSDKIRKIEEDFHAVMIEHIEEISFEKFNSILKELEEMEQQKISLGNEMTNLLRKNNFEIKAYNEVLTNLQIILATRQNLDLSFHFVTISGWIPVSNIPALEELSKGLPEDIKLLISDEIGHEEIPPSIMKHNRVTEIFGTITRFYGIPNYKEVDPTLIMTISFPIIFGLMFGDIGHGLMLFVGGLLVYFWKGKKLSASWKNLSLIITVCGICSIIGGILYGEAFGLNKFLGINLLVNDGKPILFSPLHDVMSAIKFMVILGTVMLSVGFVIEAINLSMEGKKLEILFKPIPKIAFYVGGVYLVFTYKFNLMAYFGMPLVILIIPALVLILGKLLAHVISFKKLYPTETIKGLFGGGILECWETLLSFLSNIPSFCRIFAISLAHIGLTMAVLLISDMTGVILGGIILVAGHILVVLFETLIALIQNLRLHFNEFFGKFYHGDGILFKPFTLRNQFSTLNLKNP